MFGSPASQVLFGFPTGYWFDGGSPWSVTNSIAGGPGERWEINSMMQAYNGTISSPQTTSFVYYHQFLDTLSYTVTGRGSPEVPTFTSDRLGSSIRQALTVSPAEYWFDAGSSWTVTNPLNPSNSSQRWQTDQASSGILSSVAATTLIFTYYHQISVVLSYSIIGGGSPDAPTISGTMFGNQTTGTLFPSPMTFWLDAGSTTNLAPTLVPSNGTERWATNETLSFVVNSAFTESVAYQHQYYVDAGAAETGGGSVSPASGWYNSTSNLNLVAYPSSGWRLGTWIGSGSEPYSGKMTSTRFQVEGPINETAVFYPGLNVAVESGGSVTYSYGSTSGQILSGQETLYVPPGTNVTLTASSSYFLYSAGGWAISRDAGKTTASIIVNAPMTAEAIFSYNLAAIIGLSGAAVLIAAIAALFLLEFRRRTIPR